VRKEQKVEERRERRNTRSKKVRVMDPSSQAEPTFAKSETEITTEQQPRTRRRRNSNDSATEKESPIVIAANPAVSETETSIASHSDDVMSPTIIATEAAMVTIAPEISTETPTKINETTAEIETIEPAICSTAELIEEASPVVIATPEVTEIENHVAENMVPDMTEKPVSTHTEQFNKTQPEKEMIVTPTTVANKPKIHGVIASVRFAYADMTRPVEIPLPQVPPKGDYPPYQRKPVNGSGRAAGSSCLKHQASAPAGRPVES